MRLIVTSLLAFLFVACTKDGDDQTPTPIVYADVPNWQTIAMVANMPSGFDTVNAYTTGTKSYINYKGIPYRLKAQTGLINYAVTDTTYDFYVTVFDGSDKAILDCFVTSGKYFRNGTAIYQSQSFRPNNVAPFNNNRSTPYYSR